MRAEDFGLAKWGIKWYRLVLHDSAEKVIGLYRQKYPRSWEHHYLLFLKMTSMQESKTQQTEDSDTMDWKQTQLATNIKCRSKDHSANSPNTYKHLPWLEMTSGKGDKWRIWYQWSFGETKGLCCPWWTKIGIHWQYLQKIDCRKIIISRIFQGKGHVCGQLKLHRV